MNILKVRDSISFVDSYLKLMWNVHSTYEGNSEEELELYRLGMQTFMDLIKNEVKDIIDALESKDDDEDDD